MSEEISTLETNEDTNAQGMTVVFKAHFKQRGRDRELQQGGAPPRPAPSPVLRTPRITKLMALAIHLKKLLDDGVVYDCADIARLTGVTRARISQLFNLNLLAPRIQEDILFMPKIRNGHDPITERDLRSIALKPRWDMQLKDWEMLLKKN
ncbi:MAG TPA: hypothetical protein PK745_14780 [bacterium]|nr:hypothetical protein [bacterium]